VLPLEVLDLLPLEVLDLFELPQAVNTTTHTSTQMAVGTHLKRPKLPAVLTAFPRRLRRALFLI